MHRRILAGVCAVAAAGVVAGCGTSSGTDTPGDTSLSIGLFAPQANSYVSALESTARNWAATNGAELTVYDPGFDQLKQFTQIQDAITQGELDGIIITPLNGPALAPLMKQADEAGIATVVIDSPLTDNHATAEVQVPGLDGLVVHPASERGALLGQLAVEACKGVDPCSVAYEAVLMTQPAERAIVESFESTLKKHPNINVLPVRDRCMGKRNPAVGITQDLLQAAPNIDVIVAVDQCLVGAEIALKRAGIPFGRAPSEVKLIGAGGTKQGVQNVLADEWISVMISIPNREMTLALEILTSAIDGTLPAPKGVSPMDNSKYPPTMTKETIERTGFTGQYDA